MAMRKGQYPIVKLAFDELIKQRPNTTTEEAYNLGVSLCCATMFKIITEHPDIPSFQLQAINALLEETTTNLNMRPKEEDSDYTFTA